MRDGQTKGEKEMNDLIELLTKEGYPEEVIISVILGQSADASIQKEFID